MSDEIVDSTTSHSSTTPSPALPPSKPAWPFAVIPLVLLVALMIFEMAC